jgi:DNA-binding IclR family transcriptional regulator
MHSSGIGKVVLSGYTDEGLAHYAARTGLRPRTERTISDLETLRRVVAAVRERGFAEDDGENAPGVRCVAAPVRDHTGRIKYGLSISTLSLEHTTEQVAAMAPYAIAAADKISAALGHTP